MPGNDRSGLRQPSDKEPLLLLLSRRKALTRILFAAGALLLSPERLWAEKNAFDLALQGQDLLAEGNYSQAI